MGLTLCCFAPRTLALRAQSTRDRFHILPKEKKGLVISVALGSLTREKFLSTIDVPWLVCVTPDLRLVLYVKSKSFVARRKVTTIS